MKNQVEFTFSGEWPPKELVDRANALPWGYTVKIDRTPEHRDGNPIPSIVCSYTVHRTFRRALCDTLTFTPRITRLYPIEHFT